MNIGVIFAGGAGRRMHTKDLPKQFLMVHGKPIIIHTLELFQRHDQIDGIVVSCIAEGIGYLEELVYRYRLDKVKKIVPGGETGQLSIYNGLRAAADTFGREGNIVLIHDGVRPLIDEKTISDNIAAVREHGSAVTCGTAKETFILVDDAERLVDVPSRSHSRVAKAPQSFWLDQVLSVQEQAIREGHTDVIDTCTLMWMYKKPLFVVDGPDRNVKITTPEDFYMFRALYDAMENRQLEQL